MYLVLGYGRQYGPSGNEWPITCEHCLSVYCQSVSQSVPILSFIAHHLAHQWQHVTETLQPNVVNIDT